MRQAFLQATRDGLSDQSGARVSVTKRAPFETLGVGALRSGFAPIVKHTAIASEGANPDPAGCASPIASSPAAGMRRTEKLVGAVTTVPHCGSLADRSEQLLCSPRALLRWKQLQSQQQSRDRIFFAVEVG